MLALACEEDKNIERLQSEEYKLSLVYLPVASSISNSFTQSQCFRFPLEMQIVVFQCKPGINLYWICNNQRKNILRKCVRLKKNNLLLAKIFNQN